MNFLISRSIRQFYQFEESLFSITGNVIYTNFQAARQLTHRLNQNRNLLLYPEKALKASQMYTMGLIDEILHYVVSLFKTQLNSNVMDQALTWLYQKQGKAAVSRLLHAFADTFPTIEVYNNKISLQKYINSKTEGIPNRQVVLEETMLLWLANLNPAFSPFLELFDDSGLEKNTDYLDIMTSLHEFFNAQPVFGPDHQNLIDMLRSPAIASPHSLRGQLDYIRKRWGILIKDKYLYKLLGGLDFLSEEEKIGWMGKGVSHVLVYDRDQIDAEPERFSPDSDWMPNVVMIAKNVYVWLDQLSKQYQRDIQRLDHIPDEALDTLAHRGFTALWLIGLWERSPASKRIKQLCGNPEAEASAYALYDYAIASDLGGEVAFVDLKTRVMQRGIRMAGDMVPNHMGIDSQWVIKHPDWFLFSDQSPFPAYSFTGTNLSHDDRVGIFIEDHYYDRTDAAVVFKRVDHFTNDVKFIYHGNDGTSMPWNDTAQLNFLKPEVREAVIQTILHVARLFPIIRFDAAMTLTKKHYHRLWFPESGFGGAIPSRAEQGLSKHQFNTYMPEEFWREVVDRVAAEQPDTLLLAEAFWLLESYFVRTLGMHRVYNSAFMNMLKDEDNAKYRSVIKNTLAFHPEILKRFVNFMNNPDEDTAVSQFGKDDKYFGVCMMMATLPGLPMFGHGQVEGYTEKYGMEYRRAYKDEQPDSWLVERHRREIFPLLHRRYLFADVSNFLFYDVLAPSGNVIEDVFAYSNNRGNEHALVVFHNRYAEVQGWIHYSVPFVMNPSEGETPHMIQRHLGEALRLHQEAHFYCIFRDSISGLEYIRSSKNIHENGVYIELSAYKYHVFIDFREVVEDESHHYRTVADFLGGRGVPNIEDIRKEIALQPIHEPFKALVNIQNFHRIGELTDEQSIVSTLNDMENKSLHLLSAVKIFTHGQGKESELSQRIRSELEAFIHLSLLIHQNTNHLPPKFKKMVQYTKNIFDDTSVRKGILTWILIHHLPNIVTSEDSGERGRAWMDEWLLGKIMEELFFDSGLDEFESYRCVSLIKIFLGHESLFPEKGSQKQKALHVIESIFTDSVAQQYLQINRYHDVLWFHQESFEHLLKWMFMIAMIRTKGDFKKLTDKTLESIYKHFQLFQRIKKAEKKSGYRVEKLLEILQD